MRSLLQDWSSYADSLAWGVHEAYYKERGVAAFDDGSIPHMATSHRLVARQHVRLLFDGWTLQLNEGRLPEQPVKIIEIGGGNGAFSLNFMQELEALAGSSSSAAQLYRVVEYVFTDFSAKTVKAVAKRPEWASLSGQWRAQRVDLRRPPEGPWDVLIANYVACVCPVQALQGTGEVWREKEVRISAKVKAGHDVPDVPTKRWFSAVSRTGAIKKIRTEERWSVIEPDAQSAHILSQLFPNGGDRSIVYPIGFLRAMNRWANELTPSGYILVSDLGELSTAELQGHHDWQPTQYGRSTNFGVPFPALVAWAQSLGGSAQLSQDPLASVHVAALFPNRAQLNGLGLAFDRHFVHSTEHEDLLDFVLAAELFVQEEEPESAIRFYLRALSLDPKNLDLRYAIADLYLDQELHDEALKHLLIGYKEDRFTQHDFAFNLGRLYALIDQRNEAIHWYKQALEREQHVQIWKNLGALYVEAQQRTKALRCFKKATSLDPDDKESKRTIEKLSL